MNEKTKKKEIQSFQSRLKAELPRILVEIETYEKALKQGMLKSHPTPSPQFNLG